MGVTAELFNKANNYPMNLKLGAHDVLTLSDDFDINNFMNLYVKNTHRYIAVEYLAYIRNKYVLPIDEFAFLMADLCWVKQ